jgi:hypothetical protein
MHQSAPGSHRWLVFAAAAYLLTGVLHVADHLRQHMAGLNVANTVGGLLTLAGVLTLAMVLRRARVTGPR